MTVSENFLGIFILTAILITVIILGYGTDAERRTPLRPILLKYGIALIVIDTIWLIATIVKAILGM